jgi:hypothetical protein
MAGTARRWVLPSALLSILLTAYNEWPSTSYQSSAGKSQLWQCPRCLWVEQKAKGNPPPRCCGASDDPHPMTVTNLLEGEGHSKSDGPRRFKQGDR